MSIFYKLITYDKPTIAPNKYAYFIEIHAILCNT